MSSRERQVVEAVAALFRTIAATGGYSFNFSGTEAVIVAAPVVENAITPRIYVAPRGTQSEASPALTDRRRTFEMEAWGFVAPPTQTPTERVLTALDLASEMRTMVESNLRLGGLTYDLEINTEGVDGARLGYGDCAAAHMMITAIWDAPLRSFL